MVYTYSVPPEISNMLDKFGLSLETFMLIASLIMLWSLIWKGFALWKSARLKQPIWFIALLILNTVGILEILYIFVFSEIKAKLKAEEKEEKPKPVKKRRR